MCSGRARTVKLLNFTGGTSVALPSAMLRPGYPLAGLLGLLALAHCGVTAAPEEPVAALNANADPKRDPAQPTDCARDLDCDDGDACTTDFCGPARGGEFQTRTCQHDRLAQCPNSANDAGGPPPTSQPDAAPTCNPAMGTLATTTVVERADATYGFADIWCCIGRLPDKCGYAAPYCWDHKLVVYQAAPSSTSCKSPGPGGTCTEKDAVWDVTCNATVQCRIQCDGSCQPVICQ
jgi:hypothetical protein